MRVQVQYDVPVSAVVDTASGEVEGVVVWCEAIEPRDGEFAVVGAHGQMPVAWEEQERALKIANTAIWPEWEIG
ncbi:MAG: hypothetical protein ACRDKX_06765 [Solirubrobacterales bacterium]